MEELVWAIKGISMMLIPVIIGLAVVGVQLSLIRDELKKIADNIWSLKQ